MSCQLNPGCHVFSNQVSNTLCRRYKRNHLVLTSPFTLTRLLHWFTFVQLFVFVPTEILISVFPYRSPPCGCPTTQHKAVKWLLLKVAIERPTLICFKAPTAYAVVQDTHVLRPAAVGDFGAQNCPLAAKLIKCTKLSVSVSPPLLESRCYTLFFFVRIMS